MRLGHLQQSRPAYHDRTPVAKASNYGADGIGPHGTTVRSTYTVPSGKKALLMGAQVNAYRATAAAPVGKVMAKLVVSPAVGGGTNPVLRSSAGNAVGELFGDNIGEVGVFSAGDVASLTSEDASTGGTVDYRLSMNLSEFDA